MFASPSSIFALFVFVVLYWLFAVTRNAILRAIDNAYSRRIVRRANPPAPQPRSPEEQARLKRKQKAERRARLMEQHRHQP